MKIVLCLLTLNELDCLQVVFPTIKPAAEAAGYDDIVAIDGGSTDGTLEYYAEHQVPVVGQSSRGRGQAFREAFEHIEADAYIFFSPDGNEDVADLGRFRELLKQEQADIVIASRMMPGAVNEEDDLLFKWRKWANNAFNWLANIAFGRKSPYISDAINGYRCITRQAARQLDLDAMDYTIEYQMTMRALKHGMRIVEFPTKEGARVAGDTQAKSIPTGLRFIKCFLRELFLGRSTAAPRVSRT